MIPGKLRRDSYVLGLLLLSIVGSAYLAWISISNGSNFGCAPGLGCDKVLQSRWAYWLGFPVSAPAFFVYLALLALALFARKRNSPDDERGIWAGIIVLCIVVVCSALWFVGLQVFVIKAFCKICMGIHACGFTAAVLCLKSIPHAADIDTPMWSTGSGKRGVPRKGLFSLILIGMVGVSILIGGQIVIQTPRNQVTSLSVKKVAAKKPTLPSVAGKTNTIPASPATRVIVPGILSLYNEQFLIKLDEVPLIGSVNASNVIVYLFDYTCHHCRSLHAILLSAQAQYSNSLGIVSIPMPMSTNCNHLIPSEFNSSSNACDYARLGLAVWRADRGMHRKFDDWVFAPDAPEPVDKVKEYAIQLVGAEKLEAALADPWVEAQIQTDCRLHQANWNATGRPAMPQLILGNAISLGPLNSVEHLSVLLNRYVGLEPVRMP